MATITVLLIWNVVLGCECRSVNDVMAHHLQRCWPDGGFEMGSTSISRLFSWLLAWTSQINVRKPVKWIVWNGTHQVFHLFWFQSGTAQQTQQIQHWADTAPLGCCPGFCYNEIPNQSIETTGDFAIVVVVVVVVVVAVLSLVFSASHPCFSSVTSLWISVELTTCPFCSSPYFSWLVLKLPPRAAGQTLRISATGRR